MHPYVQHESKNLCIHNHTKQSWGNVLPISLAEFSYLGTVNHTNICMCVCGGGRI